MKLNLPALVLLACVGGVLSAQTAAKPFDDPANLRGERVRGRDGNELEIDKGPRGLEQLLRKINTRASLMMIVAHPDDEDGGMLTLYSRGVGARVADLSLTRGEGGQNAMTGDFEDALGLLRTQELLASDRYTGVDQFFGTEVDFGFSKTKEEAFQKWTHERVLYDAVRAVRLYRPLVVAAVFIGGVTDGHGQHQVSGEIAQEVFKAAGDPKVFPEMIAEGILPWSPLKVYGRVPQQAITPQGLFDYATGQYTAARFVNYVTGEVSTTPPVADVVVHEGTTDPLLSGTAANGRPEPPQSYVQFARLGLGLQRTQIPAGFRVPPAGVFDVAYHRYGSRLTQQPAAEASFFEGIDTTLAGLAELTPSAPPALVREPLQGIARTLLDAQTRLDRTHPETIAPLLAEAQKQIANLYQTVKQSSLPVQERFDLAHELGIKAVQINDALVLALGIHFDAIEQADAGATNGNAVPAAQPPAFVPTAVTPVNVPVGSVVHILVRKDPGASAPGSKPIVEEQVVALKPGPTGIQKLATRPYFTRPNLEQPYYDLLDPALRNAPLPAPALVAQDNVVYQGIVVRVRSVVTAATALPDGTLFRQPLWIVPMVSIAVTPRATVVTHATIAASAPAGAPPAPDRGVKLAATLKLADGTPAAKVNVEAPAGWSVDDRIDHAPGPTGARVTEFHLRSTDGLLRPESFSVTAQIPDHTPYSEGFRSVGYPGLALTNFYTPATARAVPVDLKLPAGRRIGYVAGTGDAVAEALTAIGMQVETLTVADLTAERLQGLDAVVLGVRTYAAHPDLHGGPTAALLEYARRGGNVVVQYQTAEFTGDDAPYPLTLGRDAEKVVDETDPVVLLPPATALLSAPNPLSARDFDGWIEERGHGFLRTWDPRYQALAETHDPGQDPQRGGLITAAIGTGRWTYCALALYRQLPQAVPGAYRLFADLLGR